MIEKTIAEVKRRFSGLIGARLVWYETAELLQEDGSWTPWPDLPIRLYTDSGRAISISWSGFDALWIRTDMSLPFPLGDASIRWVRNSIENINDVVGGAINAVMIGRGEMSFDEREVDVWTRLVIRVGDSWLEIFNALDENGYDVHVSMLAGNFIPCI